MIPELRRPATFAYAFYPVLAIVVLAPFAWAFLGAFKSSSEVFAYPPTFWPRSPTFQNFYDVFQRLGFGLYIWNTALVAVLTVLATLFLGGLAAYAMSRWDFRFKNVLLVSLLGLQLIPSTVNIVPYYMIMNQLGLLNTLAALVLIYTATHTPVTIWVLRGFFDTIPRILDEAAAIDGCSKWRTFWTIILPLSLPGLSVAAFLVFVASWSEFLVPLVVATSKDVTVVSVGLYNIFGPDATSYTTLFAATVVTVVPVLLAYFWVQRYLVSGLTAFAER
jgi:ABC-type glycerol-3-phosphate transport system permease component